METQNENIKPKNKLFRSMFDSQDVIEKMKSGARKERMREKWKDLYHEVAVSGDNDWWVETEIAGVDFKEEIDFLREELK